MKLSSMLVAASVLAVAATTNAALVYGGGTQTGSRFNPGANVITYMNCFVDTSGGGTQLQLDNVTAGIRRLVSAGALIDVGLNIYVAEMTWDGTDFGRGANTMVFSTNSLGAGNASITQSVSANTNMLVNLEMTSNGPNLGGLWIGVEFTGANAANIANGWRVIGAPTTGASIDAFAMYNYQGSGQFEGLYNFTDAAGAPAPSRFMVDLSGTVVPAPGALALLSLAGLVGGRRRR